MSHREKATAGPSDPVHWPDGRPSVCSDEQYIPLRKCDLVERLAQNIDSENGRKEFRELCRLLEATLHFEFHSHLEQLKDAYAPFNPDAATFQPEQPDKQHGAQQLQLLFQGFTELLEHANYRRLSRADIQNAAGAASDWGVRLYVDFSAFERLEVYARGDRAARRTRRRWKNLYRSEEIDVPVYQRLVVIFRLNDGREISDRHRSDFVYIRIFKNVPKQDLDMLLPASRFRMTLADRGKTILPTLSGISIAVFKIIKGALLLPWFGILLLVGSTLGYGVKSFLGYLRTKDKYQLNLTRSLYYQNLGSNAGVLFRLLDEAEQQQFAEAILAYEMLRSHDRQSGWSAEEVDRKAEEFLSDVLGRRVDFDVHDALGKLRRFGCATCFEHDRWRAVPMRQALASLDRQWDAYFHPSTSDAARDTTPSVPRGPHRHPSGREMPDAVQARRTS